MATSLSRDEWDRLPNTVLYDPVSQRAASYNGIHRLITPAASPELVTYARRKAYKQAMWDEEKHDPTERWMPLPPWAGDEEERRRYVLFWVRRGDEPEEEIRLLLSLV